MTKTTIPTKVFDVVAIDTIGPFTIGEKGNRYAVTIQCDLSKYIIAIPIPDKSADTIARAVVEGCILIYGPMKATRSDQGTEYKGVFDSVCKLLNINHTLATAYHPQTLGALERNQDDDSQSSSDNDTILSADTNIGQLIPMTEIPLNYFRDQIILKIGPQNEEEYEEVFPKVFRRTIAKFHFSIPHYIDIFYVRDEYFTSQV